MGKSGPHIKTDENVHRKRKLKSSNIGSICSRAYSRRTLRGIVIVLGLPVLCAMWFLGWVLMMVGGE